MNSVRPMDILDAHGDSLDRAVRPVLEAWRSEKKVYNFDPALRAALWKSPIEDKVPPRYFRRLPAPCVYIPTPGDERQFQGFFACALDGYLDLVRVDAQLGLSTTTATLWANSPTIWTMYPSDTYSMPPLISLTLYLCGEEPRRRRNKADAPRPKVHRVEYKGTPRRGRWVLDDLGLGMIWVS